jgi:hypothetical protein
VKFPRAQYDAIQRGKAEDIQARSGEANILSHHIRDLQQKEKGLNDMYWSLFQRGKCSDDLLANYLMHERNALRVRIARCSRRAQII